MGILEDADTEITWNGNDDERLVQNFRLFDRGYFKGERNTAVLSLGVFEHPSFMFVLQDLLQLTSSDNHDFIQEL